MDGIVLAGAWLSLDGMGVCMVQMGCYGGLWGQVGG
jgi:hypothetical protein